MTSAWIVDVAEDVPAPGLQLHVRSGAGAYNAVYGWEPSPIDAGPPPGVDEMFASALVRCGTVAFLDVPEQRTRRRGWFHDVESSWLPVHGSWLDWLHRRRPPWIRVTDNAACAHRIFDGSVSWDMQAQVAFVLIRGARPSFDRNFIWKLLCARDVPIGDLNLPAEVLALVLPAVDGSYVEIVVRDPALRQHIRDVIAAECDQRGILFGSA